MGRSNRYWSSDVCVATATGRDRLRRPAPLRLLGSRVTTRRPCPPGSPGGHGTPESAAGLGQRRTHRLPGSPASAGPGEDCSRLAAPPQSRMTRALARVFAGSKDVPNGKDCCMPTTTTPQVRFRTFDGVRIRYADSGSSPKPAVLLTSPWPESVYAFAPARKSHSKSQRGPTSGDTQLRQATVKPGQVPTERH